MKKGFMKKYMRLTAMVLASSLALSSTAFASVTDVYIKDSNGKYVSYDVANVLNNPTLLQRFKAALAAASLANDPVVVKDFGATGEKQVELGIEQTYEEAVNTNPVSTATPAVEALDGNVENDVPIATTTAAFTIYFTSNGGSAVADMVVTPNGIATAPVAPIYANHTFDGWFTDAALTTPFDFATTAIEKNIRLFAKWTQVGVTMYTVTFNSNEGSAVTAMTVTGGSVIATAPTAPTKTGFTFDAWYKEATFVNKFAFATDTITTNTTLFAKWIAQTGINIQSVRVVNTNNNPVGDEILAVMPRMATDTGLSYTFGLYNATTGTIGANPNLATTAPTYDPTMGGYVFALSSAMTAVGAKYQLNIGQTGFATASALLTYKTLATPTALAIEAVTATGSTIGVTANEINAENATTIPVTVKFGTNYVTGTVHVVLEDSLGATATATANVDSDTQVTINVDASALEDGTITLSAYLAADSNISPSFAGTNATKDAKSASVSGLTGTRTGATTGTVSFTAAKTGTAKYLVKEYPVATEPTVAEILASGTSVTVTATNSATTISLSNMVDGKAYKLYFVITDSSKNTSSVNNVSLPLNTAVKIYSTTNVRLKNATGTFNGVYTWDPVTSAGGYKVGIKHNNVDAFTTDADLELLTVNEVDLSTYFKAVGSYTISVTTLGDGVNFTNSDVVQASTAVVVNAAPTFTLNPATCETKIIPATYEYTTTAPTSVGAVWTSATGIAVPLTPSATTTTSLYIRQKATTSAPASAIQTLTIQKKGVTPAATDIVVEKVYTENQKVTISLASGKTNLQYAVKGATVTEAPTYTDNFWSTVTGAAIAVSVGDKIWIRKAVSGDIFASDPILAYTIKASDLVSFYTVANLADLEAALVSSYSDIKVTTDVSLTTDVTIPAGKNVTLDKGVTLILTGHALTVNGNLQTLGSNILTAASLTTDSSFNKITVNTGATLSDSTGKLFGAVDTAVTASSAKMTVNAGSIDIVTNEGLTYVFNAATATINEGKTVVTTDTNFALDKDSLLKVNGNLFVEANTAPAVVTGAGSILVENSGRINITRNFFQSTGKITISGSRAAWGYATTEASLMLDGPFVGTSGTAVAAVTLSDNAQLEIINLTSGSAFTNIKQITLTQGTATSNSDFITSSQAVVATGATFTIGEGKKVLFDNSIATTGDAKHGKLTVNGTLVVKGQAGLAYTSAGAIQMTGTGNQDFESGATYGIGSNAGTTITIASEDRIIGAVGTKARIIPSGKITLTQAGTTGRVNYNIPATTVATVNASFQAFVLTGDKITNEGTITLLGTSSDSNSALILPIVASGTASKIDFSEAAITGTALSLDVPVGTTLTIKGIVGMTKAITVTDASIAGTLNLENGVMLKVTGNLNNTGTINNNGSNLVVANTAARFTNAGTYNANATSTTVIDSTTDGALTLGGTAGLAKFAIGSKFALTSGTALKFTSLTSKIELPVGTKLATTSAISTTSASFVTFGSLAATTAALVTDSAARTIATDTSLLLYTITAVTTPVAAGTATTAGLLNVVRDTNYYIMFENIDNANEVNISKLVLTLFKGLEDGSAFDGLDAASPAFDPYQMYFSTPVIITPPVTEVIIPGETVTDTIAPAFVVE